MSFRSPRGPIRHWRGPAPAPAARALRAAAPVALAGLATALAWLALASPAALSGCGRATTERHHREGEDPLGDRTVATGTSIALQPSDARAQLMRADALWRNGDFAQALPLYRRIYAQRYLDPELRAEAAFAWAQLEGDLLNPRRDLDAAIARLESFLAEFPESALAPEATAALERLRALRLRERAARGDTLPAR